ncbi:MAG: DUF4203 domain-containing protein [Eubacterium sp.]|nr:DUF4203 domain-containing protein [Eubacterium sp.]
MEHIENIEEIISYLGKAKKLSDLLNLEGFPGGPEAAAIASQIVVAAAVITLILSLLQCFFGYKMLRFWVALIGFVIGFAAGSGIIANIMEVPSKVLIVLVGITAGALLGILAFKLYVVGVFIYCGMMGAAAAALLPFKDQNETMQTAQMVLMIIVFIVSGVLAVIFQRYVIVIVSAVAGGMHAAGALSTLVPELASEKMTAAAAVVLIILGIGVQLLTTRDRKKKAKKKE